MKHTHPPVRHLLTPYSANMSTISDDQGNLIAVLNGPRSARNALLFREILDLMREMEVMGIADVEDLLRCTIARQDAMKQEGMAN
jgi:hypothetical protein